MQIFPLWPRWVLGSCLVLTVVAEPRPADPAEALSARVAELRREIVRHDALYFQQAAPEITDSAYDELKQELARLLANDAAEEEDSHFDDRPTDAAEWWHDEPMRSLQKAYRPEHIDAFYARLGRTLGQETIPTVVEPKIDGVAVGLLYNNGVFVGGGTRGNGRRGENITAKLRHWSAVPAQLNVVEGQIPPSRLELRGEIYVTHEQFQRINLQRTAAGEPPISHPRTLVAAALRQKQDDVLDELGIELAIFGVGAVEPAEALPRAQASLREWFAGLGLPALAHARQAADDATLHQVLVEMEAERTSYPFPTDGVVIKVDDLAAQQRLGSTPGAPRWAIARKFTPERAWTTLQAITWQVGRTGVLTPVGEVDPVALGGVTVRRVALSHFENVARRDLRPGDRVQLERVGDVIPVLTEVEPATGRGPDPASLRPDSCPGCGGALEARSVHLWCLNVACPGQLARRLDHYVGRAGLDIKGLGPAAVAVLVETRKVTRIADLYQLTAEDFPARGQQIVAAIARSRNAPLDRVLLALGVPAISERMAAEFALRYGTLQEWWEAGPHEWTQVTRGTAVSAATWREYLASDYNREEIQALSAAGVGRQSMSEKGEANHAPSRSRP
jgi:DNA ligase (NAD+)